MFKLDRKSLKTKIGVLAGAAVVTTVSLLGAAPAANAAGPAAVYNRCGGAYLHNGMTVQNCGIWIPARNHPYGVPVFASVTDHTIRGYLRVGGYSANWFKFRVTGPGYTPRGYTYRSTDYAFTLSDPNPNGRPEWGYVSGAYFKGTSSKWEGLRSPTPPPPCKPGSPC